MTVDKTTQGKTAEQLPAAALVVPTDASQNPAAKLQNDATAKLQNDANASPVKRGQDIRYRQCPN